MIFTPVTVRGMISISSLRKCGWYSESRLHLTISQNFWTIANLTTVLHTIFRAHCYITSLRTILLRLPFDFDYFIATACIWTGSLIYFICLCTIDAWSQKISAWNRRRLIGVHGTLLATARCLYLYSGSKIHTFSCFPFPVDIFSACSWISIHWLAQTSCVYTLCDGSFFPSVFLASPVLVHTFTRELVSTRSLYFPFFLRAAKSEVCLWVRRPGLRKLHLCIDLMMLSQTSVSFLRRLDASFLDGIIISFPINLGSGLLRETALQAATLVTRIQLKKTSIKHQLETLKYVIWMWTVWYSCWPFILEDILRVALLSKTRDFELTGHWHHSKKYELGNLCMADEISSSSRLPSFLSPFSSLPSQVARR